MALPVSYVTREWSQEKDTARDLLGKSARIAADAGVPSGIITAWTPRCPACKLDLWRADAIVLFDWLMSVDLNDVPIAHPAEKQALADLLTRLENETDIPGVTRTVIDNAREEVARDMGS